MSNKKEKGNMAHIEKLTLKVGNKTIELSTEEAKQLKEALSELFGETIRYVPSQPIVIDRWRERYPWWPNIVYGTSGNVTLCAANSEEQQNKQNYANLLGDKKC